LRSERESERNSIGELVGDERRRGKEGRRIRRGGEEEKSWTGKEEGMGEEEEERMVTLH
jgi:hypothetical protein